MMIPRVIPSTAVATSAHESRTSIAQRSSRTSTTMKFCATKTTSMSETNAQTTSRPVPDHPLKTRHGRTIALSLESSTFRCQYTGATPEHSERPAGRPAGRSWRLNLSCHVGQETVNS